MKAENMNWLVWSNEHGMWWSPNRLGYTPRRELAGRFQIEEAIRILSEANLYSSDTQQPNETMVPD